VRDRRGENTKVKHENMAVFFMLTMAGVENPNTKMQPNRPYL
jgi:hypothetical protein